MDDTTTTPTFSDRECMLTTIDNPFNPFTQWDEWQKLDRDQGYYTNEYLARVAATDDLNTNEQNDRATRAAMEEIVMYNPTGLWVLAFKPNEQSSVST